MSDPLHSAIVCRLLDVGSAASGEIGKYVRRRFKIGASAVSDRLRRLVDLRIVERQNDGTFCLTDPVELERIVQAARMFVVKVYGDTVRVETADHQSLAGRLNDRDVPLDFDASDVIEQSHSSPADGELLDDVAAKTDFELASAAEPPIPPEVVLGRRVVRRRSADWPAVVWVSERDHSRSAGDLVDAPARYLPAPIRLLIVSLDWHEFDALIQGWARRYEGGRFARDFLLWAILDEVRLVGDAVLAPAVLDCERNLPAGGDLDESALRELVHAALPSISAQLEQNLRMVWGDLPEQPRRSRQRKA